MYVYNLNKKASLYIHSIMKTYQTQSFHCSGTTFVRISVRAYPPDTLSICHHMHLLLHYINLFVTPGHTIYIINL